MTTLHKSIGGAGQEVAIPPITVIRQVGSGEHMCRMRGSRMVGADLRKVFMSLSGRSTDPVVRSLALVGVAMVVMSACDSSVDEASTSLTEAARSSSTSTTQVPADVRVLVDGVVVNGSAAHTAGDGFNLSEPVNPGDVLEIEAAITGTPAEVTVLGMSSDVTDGAAVVEVVVPHDLRSADIPIVVDGVPVSSLTIVPGDGWVPMIVVEDLTGTTGDVTVDVEVFDLNGPDTVESLDVMQEFNFQHPDHADGVIAEAGVEPTSVEELVSGAIEVRFSDPAFDFVFTADKKIAEYVSNSSLAPVEVKEIVPGSFEIRFDTAWPGRFPLHLSATDIDGNVTTLRIPVDVYWAEHPLEEIRGIGTGVIVPGDPAYYETYIDAISSLNVNLLQINVHGHLESLTASDVANCDFVWSPGSDCQTGSPEDVARLSALAHDAGMEVMLKFHAVPGQYEPTWMMRPDWEEFFSLDEGALSYSNWVLQWAEFAEQNGIEHLSVGNELTSSHSYTDGWTRLIGAVREVYGGKLTYADNFWVFWYNGGNPTFEACHLLDYQGLNFYYRGSGGDVGGPASLDPTAAEMRTNLVAQVEEIFRPAVEQCANLPVIITEMGMGPVDGGNRRPETDWGVGAALDHVEQAEFYMVALEVMSRYPWFVGAIVWQYQPQLQPWSQSDLVPGDIRGLPVEQALRIFFNEP